MFDMLSVLMMCSLNPVYWSLWKRWQRYFLFDAQITIQHSLRWKYHQMLNRVFCTAGRKCLEHMCSWLPWQNKRKCVCIWWSWKESSGQEHAEHSKIFFFTSSQSSRWWIMGLKLNHWSLWYSFAAKKIILIFETSVKSDILCLLSSCSYSYPQKIKSLLTR